ncbi:MAG: alcohol dehydrogenase catalytic domain-containing protein [Candidatus Thermoplasmatota archaeon]|nr:alcohol dehydrogenase catalytic domain-containing protein [Candidatus Thermoplasmatota archaeon]
MKAAVLETPQGLEYLKIREIEEKGSVGKIRIKVIQTGINPVDYNLIHGKIIYGINPIPHIPGTECYGTALSSGHSIREGDSVIVYPRLYDGTCDFCLDGHEELCINGGLFGVNTNGSYAEEIYVDERNVYRVSGIDKDLAGSIPVGGLTAYHAIKRTRPREGESILVYGASGNTGIWAVQIAKSMGLKVIAVSGKSWISEYGADKVYRIDEIPEDLKTEIVMNSLGGSVFADSLHHIQRGGRIVTFGIYNGKESTLDLSRVYSSEISIFGTTGGSRDDMNDILKLARTGKIRMPVEKRFDLKDIREAMTQFKSKSTGRIVIEPTNA